MNERHFEITVPEHKSKERLDAFLSRELAQLSRNKIQKLIKDGLITVNGKCVKPNHSVQPLESVSIIIPKPSSSNILPQDIPLEIVYEDEYLLVVNKSAGMVVHPAYGHFEGTLVNALLAHTLNLSLENKPGRPGIVHRLDKDTSGLLVVAKDDEVHESLAEQFSEKTVEREYQAIVWGKLPKSSGTVETLLARSIKDRRKIMVASTGKSAVTHYQVEERFSFLSYMRIYLETGRTHQIRVHMAHIGHPVFGDPTYGGRTRHLTGLNRNDLVFATELLGLISRQALHAKTLGFIHPVLMKKMTFDSELPEDFQNVLEKLKSNQFSEGNLSIDMHGQP
jgi:23S rRNA pseudouridine1911/1915/1917 synthase